jgi:16S rRNA (uracil1498-N3)-methyltransferase
LVDAREAHHARDVLRLIDGATVEVFDDAGATAQGTLIYRGSREVFVRVNSIEPPPASSVHLVIASAIPKGSRADWMVEKLSELGVDAFVPLATARSVVLPEGQQKRLRWERIAAEAAKQSRRSGVMRIEPMMNLDALIQRIAENHGVGGYGSTSPAALPIMEVVDRWQSTSPGSSWTVAIGPEGGWTNQEIVQLDQASFLGLKLTSSVLRVETAAVAAAAVVKGVVL